VRSNNREAAHGLSGPRRWLGQVAFSGSHARRLGMFGYYASDFTKNRILDPLRLTIDYLQPPTTTSSTTVNVAQEVGFSRPALS